LAKWSPERNSPDATDPQAALSAEQQRYQPPWQSSIGGSQLLFDLTGCSPTGATRASEFIVGKLAARV
jgi:hypothetical protein